MRLPKDRAASKSDDVTDARFGGAWGAIRVPSMQASKICINITTNRKVSSWFDNHSHLTSAVKVSDNGFNCQGMTSLWIVAKSSNLTDGEGDIEGVYS
jgi:hypothetical protein